MYVCLSDDNFRKPWRKKFIFAHPVHLQGIPVKFVYEGHRIKVKVTAAEKVKRIPIYPQCKTSIGNNSGPINQWRLRVAWFLAMADRMMWTPPLSRDRKWPRVTKCTHSRVVGLRLKGSLVISLIYENYRFLLNFRCEINLSFCFS